MWAGSKASQSIETYVLSDADTKSADTKQTFQLTELKYPPALLKIVDEIIVNAIDHHTIYPKEVNRIDITFTDDGTISVFNNGHGITVEKTKTVSGVEMFTPQLIFSEFLAGSNLDDQADQERVVGGVNGIGAKLTALFSNEFIVETTDEVNKVFYRQVFKNQLDLVGEPEITPLSNKSLLQQQQKGHTKITFTPNYAEFKVNITDFKTTFRQIIETRAWQAAAYTSAKVTFNGAAIKLGSFSDFCQMFTEFEVHEAKMTRPDGKFPWSLCVGVSDGKERNVSIVNGLVVGRGGNHILHIQRYLIDQYKDRIEKELKKAKLKFNKNFLLNNLFIFMKGAIPNPDLGGQTKDTINNPLEQFELYHLSKSDIEAIWILVEPAVMSTFLKKQLGDVKLRANRGKIEAAMYREANYARVAKKCLSCGLIVTEGESATGTANEGILSGVSPDFNYDYYGTYGLRGVVVNGLKESIDFGRTRTKTGDTKRRAPNKKLLANERMSTLIKVLGLDFNKTYETDKEFSTVRYGFIAGLTDQDLDGFNIFGLLATFFLTYFPALIRRGFVRRINTPVVRAYPKNKKLFVEEFFTERQARAWIESIGEAKAKSLYTFKYYKGLASHVPEKGEVKQMFKNINDKICTYVLDAEAIEQMYIYYGDDTKPRKLALSTPVSREPIEGLRLPLSQQYEIDTKLFQRDNIIRKLLSAIDGFVTSRRKVFYTACRVCRSEEIKVAGLASDVVRHANYHHGEESVSQTIVRMAQGFPQARNLPLLIPLGGFGSRDQGYKNYGASRYIFTKLNTRLTDKLFPREDEFLLDYELEDGERYEPKYYVPIVPYALLETNELPATGWAINVQARDQAAVFKAVRHAIANRGPIAKMKRLPISMRDFKGTIKVYNKRQYSVGVYVFDEKENTIHITELPHGVFSSSYLNGGAESIKKKAKRAADGEERGIAAKEHIEDYQDDTTRDGINITLYLKPGAYEAISADYGNEMFDCFEEYLELKRPIYHRLNLINHEGRVVEYETYEQIFKDWFVIRKDLYQKRTERETILNDLEIQMLNGMQRFSREHADYKITTKTKEPELIEIIRKNKYKIFNKSMISNPRFNSVDDLVRLITTAEHGASYEYLLSMTYRDLTEEAYSKRAKRIADLEERQALLTADDLATSFKGAKMWLRELDELEAAIAEGQKSKWFYGENDWKFK